MLYFRRSPRLFYTLTLWILLPLVTGLNLASADETRTFRVYLDADRQANYETARSIEMGVRAAFADPSLHPEGVAFEIVPLDHRGNSKRSFRNIRTYLNDAEGVAIFGGQHSSGYLTYRTQINERGALLLLPWSAAGPITRSDTPLNWIFRASVDDTKAGEFLVNEAVSKGNCTAPSLILLNSGWGRANERTIKWALAERGIFEPPTFYFDAEAAKSMIRLQVSDIRAAGADCVIMITNAAGGAKFVSALAEEEEVIRAYSHWGVMGADFSDATTADERARLDFQFIQTCLPFESSSNPALNRAVAAARREFPGEFTTFEERTAPAGFAHAYDLGLLLLAAMRSTPLTGDISDIRAQIRERLENMEKPVEGLLKTYTKPFSNFGSDRHEALGARDLCLARYNEQGRVVFPSVGDVAARP